MIQRANSKFRISERDPESGTVSSRHEPMMQGLQRRLAWLGLHKKLGQALLITWIINQISLQKTTILKNKHCYSCKTFRVLNQHVNSVISAKCEKSHLTLIACD